MDSSSTRSEPGEAGAFTYYNLARVFEWTGTAVLVVLIIFLASVGYSASEVSYQGISPPTYHTVGNNMVLLNTTVNISNPGSYAFTGFGMDLRVLLPNVGLIATGASPVITIGSGGYTGVPVVLPVNLASPIVRPLLTNSTTLMAEVWVNGTYAHLFPLGLKLSENLDWGAPFHDLSYSLGSPTPPVNGTVSLNFTLSFTDESPIPIVGTLGLKTYAANGTFCGQAAPLSIIDGFGFPYSGKTTLTVSEFCRPATVDATFTSPLLNLSLPPEPIP